MAVHRQLVIRRAIGFFFGLALTLLLALDGGGYDIVVRHEIAIVVWVAIAIGLATGVLPRSRLNRGAWLALGGFVGLILLMALAHSWTESDERTTAEMARALQYLGIVLLAYLALNRHTWQGAAAGFITAGMVVPLFALLSRLFPDLLVDDVARQLHFDRLSYPLDYWNAVACWGAMAIAAGLCVSAHAERRALRALALAAVPVATLSVYLTYSRFGVAAAAIAMLAAFAVSHNRWTVSLNALVAAAASAFVILVTRGEDQIARATGSGGSGAVILALLAGSAACAFLAMLSSEADPVRMPRSSARYAVVGVAICVLLAGIALQGPISRGWEQFKNDRAVAAGSDPTSRLGSLGGNRYEVWKAAIHAFQTDPARGIGPGSFEFYWSREGANAEFIRNPHSLYLEQLSELGVFGLIAILVALIGLLLAAVTARVSWDEDRDLAAGTALIAAFVVFLAYAAVDWMWELGAVGTLAMGGAAVAGAGGLRRGRPQRLSLWLRTGAVVLALGAGVAQVPTLVSVQRTRASDAALARGDLSGARRLADDAIRAEPWAASPYAMRALVFESQGQLASARADLEHAREREPTNWRYPLILARVDAMAGNRAAMENDLAEVQRLAPHSLFVQPGSPYRSGLDQLLSQAGKKAG